MLRVKQLLGYLAVLPAAFLGLSALPALSAIDSSDAKVTRLKLQGIIDTDAPFSKTLWAGAHNAYASRKWDNYYADPNQWYEPKDLFERGIRLVECDVYPEAFDYSSVMMCHFGNKEDALCGASAKPFVNGLEHIGDYIDDNPHEIIVLKIEAYNSNFETGGQDFRKRLAEKIENKIGDKLFKPEDWGYSDSECASLPVHTLTKKDILSAGKNIIAITQTPRDKNLCNYHNNDKYKRWVWIGADEKQSDGSFKNSEVYNQEGGGLDCNDLKDTYDLGNFSIALDSTTHYDADDIWMSGTKAKGAAICGAQVLEAALVEANNTSLSSPNVPDAIQIEDYLWSWRSGEPSGNGDCANSYDDGYVNDSHCDTHWKYACVNADRSQWKITSTSGKWEDGFSACSSLGDGYSFGMPYNALENNLLIQAKGSESRVWLNYFEATDGFWVANKSAQEHSLYYTNTYASKGDTSGGSAFDDADLVKRKLLHPNLNIVSFHLTRGSSGYLDSIQTCYGYGQTVSPATATSNTLCRRYGQDGNGGSSASLTLDTDNGEYVNIMQFCANSSRVTYLKLQTNKGRSVTIGSCNGTSYSTTGDAIIGFFGTDSNVVNSLGAHKINSQLAVVDYYDTGWLDRDNQYGSGDHERVSSHINSGNISSSCSTSDLVGYVARDISTKVSYQALGQNVQADASGFRCLNSANGGDNSCKDYEVRYFFNKNCSP